MSGKIAPYHSDLHRDITLWLQANRDLTAEDRIHEVKMMLYKANLDELTLLHYAANAFVVLDKMLVQCNEFPSHLMRSVIGGKEVAEHLAKTRKAKFAAAQRHKRTNEAKAEIVKIWSSGKYSSRDICAEQECAALNLSFSTARKALRGTPNPTPKT
jgi:hypothetical protein